MKIEAVIVSVDYGDFLAYSLPANKRHFDNLVVVTAPHDEHTKAICAYHHVRCVETDEFYQGNDPFNKAKGINYGLAHLALDGWVVHLDADIVLPPRARELLHKIELDPAVIYGLDRIMCPSFEAWQEFVSNPEQQHTDEVFVTANAYQLGSRVARLDRDGYVPIGFFQMWHPARSGVTRYPVQHGTAGRTDMLFAMQWPRRRRALIPEIVAIHLESEAALCGTNWRGRQTKPFGYAPCKPRPVHRGGYDG
jgi:hypothetical protein